MGWIIGVIGGMFTYLLSKKKKLSDLGFGRPVALDRKITVGFGWRPITHSIPHSGLDIGLPVGTPLFSVGDGVVKRLSKTPAGDPGIYVEVLHDNGMLTRYLHMSKVIVNKDQRINKGQQLGLSGNTGLSEGPHLHFEIRVPNPLLLGMIRDAVGEPVGGFDKRLPGIGIGIPAEPWIPVDGYSESVKKNALLLKIPLYKDRS